MDTGDRTWLCPLGASDPDSGPYVAQVTLYQLRRPPAPNSLFLTGTHSDAPDSGFSSATSMKLVTSPLPSSPSPNRLFLFLPMQGSQQLLCDLLFQTGYSLLGVVNTVQLDSYMYSRAMPLSLSYLRPEVKKTHVKWP